MRMISIKLKTKIKAVNTAKLHFKHHRVPQNNSNLVYKKIILLLVILRQTT